MAKSLMIPPRIGCVSQKGGGGKSTLAVNLTVAAALDRRAPTLLDLDDQKSAAALFNTFRRQTGAPPVDIRGIGWDELAADLEAMKGSACGLVIIDTPGQKNQVSSLAASASNIVLVAVQTPMIDLATLQATFTLKNVTNRPAYVVLNRVRNKANLKEARAVVTGMGFELCPVALSDLSCYPDAFDRGLGVLEYQQGEGWSRKAANELAQAQEEISALYGWAMERVSEHQTIRLPAAAPTWSARQ